MLQKIMSVAVITLFSVLMAFGQASDAEIAGTARDTSGGPVAGAMITLSNQDSGFTRNASSDGEGRYRFAALAPGRYSLKLEAPGFKTENVTGIVLDIGTHAQKDFSLTVGSVQETISVSGEVLINCKSLFCMNTI